MIAQSTSKTYYRKKNKDRHLPPNQEGVLSREICFMIPKACASGTCEGNNRIKITTQNFFKELISPPPT